MSFPSSFGPQVAAIMDVLAKAAVAEITKLVEDGSVELRMEVCRKEREVQELQRSLKLLEAQLCRVREAAASRATEDKQQQTAERTDEEVRVNCAIYLEQKPAGLSGAPQQEPEDQGDTRLVVKLEPADEPVTQETTSTNSATGGEPVWPPPPPSCRMFEKGAVLTQQQIQMFSPHTEPLSAHRNSENSRMSSSSATEESGDESSSVPIKVELDVRPVCIGNTSAEFGRKASFRPCLQPAGSQNRFLQASSHQPGPSLAHRSTAGPNQDPNVFGRNNMRTKRQFNTRRSVCNKGHPRLSQLEEHKASHQPSKPFRCLKCGKSFTQKTRLKTHQSVHTGERPFSCKICGKMFSRHDNCLRHERFHSGQRPYSCGQCGKSFTVLGNLKIHQEIHLQGR